MLLQIKIWNKFLLKMRKLSAKPLKEYLLLNLRDTFVDPVPPRCVGVCTFEFSRKIQLEKI